MVATEGRPAKTKVMVEKKPDESSVPPQHIVNLFNIRFPVFRRYGTEKSLLHYDIIFSFMFEEIIDNDLFVGEIGAARPELLYSFNCEIEQIHILETGIEKEFHFPCSSGPGN